MVTPFNQLGKTIYIPGRRVRATRESVMKDGTPVALPYGPWLDSKAVVIEVSLRDNSKWYLKVKDIYNGEIFEVET